MDGAAEAVQWVTQNEEGISYVKKLGQGGYGEVHKYFARKLIRPFAGITDLEIQNEVRAMDTLCRGSHDNIIAIYNHGRLAPPHAFYFIDMELCDINLEEYIYCKRTGVLGLMEWDKAIADGHGVFLICGIMQQILSGLQFIHDHGEVHRDLNPQNILYSASIRSWKIADFGLTSSGTLGSKTTEGARGKEGYRAPELLSELRPRYSQKVDIWSVGCLLFELVIGEKAFRNDFKVLQLIHLGYKREVNLPEWVDESSKAVLHPWISEMLDAEAQNRPSMDHMWTRLVDIVILMVLPAHASTSSLAALLPYPGIILGTDVPTSNFYLNWEDVFAPGNYKQHARLIQRFKDIAGARKVLLGREHPYTLWTLNSLAWAEFMVGEPLNAAPVFDEIVKTKRRLLGEKHLETLSACCGLATLYRFVEPDYKRSLELFQETLRILKAEYGREHPITLACLQGLAFAYVRVGRSEVGAQYYDECLEIQMRKLGPLNPNTLRTRLSIEYSHFGARLAAAEESALIYEELVRLFVEQNGLEHIDTLESMYLRASVYLQLGQGTKAVMFSAEVLAARSWVLGPCHRGTLFSMEMLAKGYHQLGKVELGDRLLDQVRMARG